MDVISEALAMAEQIAEIDPTVLAFTKCALHFGAAHPMAEAMKNEQSESAAMKAAREGS